MDQIARRGFITGLSALIAAPAIVRAESLMKVRGLVPFYDNTPLVPYGVSPAMLSIQMLRDAMRQMEENTRRLYEMPLVAVKTTFENGRFVQRGITAADLYR